MGKVTLLTALLVMTLAPLKAQQLIRKEVIVDQTLRTYLVHLPAGEEMTPELPLVINMHGFGSNATEQAAYSRFNILSDFNKFIVVYPEGLEAEVPNLGSGQHWNSYFQTGVDDVAFINEIIDLMWNEYTIDVSRVYAAGMSNGGFMAYTLACELSDRFAAISSITGSMINEAFGQCEPQRAVPVLQFHGTEDMIVPYEGNELVAPIEDVMTFWVENNGCSYSFIETDIEDTDDMDNSTVIRYLFNDCTDGLEVDFYRIIGGGHTWPGAILEQPQLGATNGDINASTLSWQFFEKYVHPDPRAPRVITNNENTFNQPLLVYPTQVDDHFTIESPEPVEFTIVNITGKTIYSGTVQNGINQFSTIYWPHGIYILSATNRSGKSQHFRLLK